MGRRSWSSEQHGQSIVELATLLPLLVALLIVGGDMARGYYYAVIVADAAEQGARQATKTPQDDAKIKSVALQSAPLGLLATSNVAITGSRQAGGAVTVTVSIAYKPITPFAKAIVGDPVAVTHAATLRVR
jgi:Flp pilus assembly protein TadG